LSSARAGAGGRRVKQEPSFAPLGPVTGLRFFAAEAPDTARFDLLYERYQPASERPDSFSMGLEIFSPAILRLYEKPDAVLMAAEYSSWIDYDNSVLTLP